MKFYKYNIAILTGIILMMISGCATTYTVHLIDEESQKPAPNIPIEILDENGRNQLKSDESNAEGQYIIDLKTIPGDSFKIEINDNDYFEISEWITTPDNSEEKRLILEKRVTIITGWVLEDSTDIIGIPNCKITTSPATAITTTDEKGKFVLKSNGFAEGLPYTIFASKPPRYHEKSTSITPNINKKNDLENAIFLDRITLDLEDIRTKGKEETKVIEGLDPPIN